LRLGRVTRPRNWPADYAPPVGSPFQFLGTQVRAHWLVLVNASVGLVLVGAVAAPVLAFAGFSGAADNIHQVYLWLCPQRPGHSYFLLGHQLALEEREMAMFTAQFLGGLLYWRLRRQSRFALSPIAFLLASVPFTWDVLSQMLALRTSGWFTRSWTGALFTLAFVFWCYPRLERNVEE